MEDINKFMRSTVLLIVLFASIGWILSYQEQSEAKMAYEKESVHEVLTLVGTTEYNKDRAMIVTDKYANRLEKNAKTVTFARDGSIYSVQNGVVLVDDMIIEKSGEENSVIYLKKR